jgi:hypothetical protein
MLFWLAATIDASAVDMGDDFDLAKVDIGWRNAPDSLTRLNDGIVVVRLVGSPLMPQADESTPLWDPRTGKARRGQTILGRLGQLAATAAGSDEKTFRHNFRERGLLPAFMLDEYSGMHQISAIVQGSLAANLLNLEPAWLYRFWLAVGVQLDDVLVRLLVASHVDTSSGPRALLDHHGVMVNRYVSKAEVDLLAWQGFDAVQARFNQVTPDLQHYAAHMRYRSPEELDPETGEIRLSTNWDAESTFTSQGKCRVDGSTS